MPPPSKQARPVSEPPSSVPALRQFLLQAVGGAGTLWLVGFALRFLTGILLTRLLGVTQYGLYSLAFVYVEALSILASLGLHALLVRYLPGYLAAGDAAATRGILQLTGLASLGTAVLCTAAGAWGVLVLLDPASTLREPLLLGVLLVTAPSVWLRLRQATLQGFSRVVQAQLGESFVRPLLSVLLLTGLYLVHDDPVRAVDAVWMSFAAAAGGAIFADVLTRRAVRGHVDAAPAYHQANWLRSLLPLFGISLFTILNTRVDLFVLGFLDTTESVGLFSVVERITLLTAFVMGVFTATFAPRIGTFHAAGDMHGLQEQLTALSRAAFAVTLPLAVLLYVFGGLVLSIFGSAFVAGEAALRILLIGQLANVACGAVGMVLSMTGHERIAFRGMVLTGSLNLLLDILLIPAFSIYGAAAATAATVTLTNLVLLTVVRRRTGLDASIIGRMHTTPAT